MGKCAACGRDVSGPVWGMVICGECVRRGYGPRAVQVLRAIERAEARKAHWEHVASEAGTRYERRKAQKRADGFEWAQERLYRWLALNVRERQG